MAIFKVFAMLGFMFGVAAFTANIFINSAQNYEIRHLQHEITVLQHQHK